MTPDHIPDFTPTLHVFAGWVALAIAVLVTAIAIGLWLATVTGLQVLVYLTPGAVVVAAVLACFYFLGD
ncbi:MAG: hypothetical protein FD152_2054 [Xanthobacteraceae bacterium]|nr:MAG: hypothetical protein FD152_2054 [Xanthobacteraceae bacterium]